MLYSAMGNLYRLFQYHNVSLCFWSYLRIPLGNFWHPLLSTRTIYLQVHPSKSIEKDKTVRFPRVSSWIWSLGIQIPHPLFAMTNTGLQPLAIAINAVAPSLAVIFVALRLYSRHFTTRNLGWDDSLIVIPMIMAIVMAVTVHLSENILKICILI